MTSELDDARGGAAQHLMRELALAVVEITTRLVGGGDRQGQRAAQPGADSQQHLGVPERCGWL